jgi:LIVCS family branched-chain amino acid:cation transporter
VKKQSLQSPTFIAALALFAMLFGAGNLVFPIKLGMRTGAALPEGLAGFLLSAVGLPLLGLLGILLFDGNYEKFFGRLGKYAGNLVIIICILILGPVVGIPRLITFAHTAIVYMGLSSSAVFTTITPLSSFLFSLLFLVLVFIAACREKKLLTFLGVGMGATLLIALCITITKGLLWAPTTTLYPLREPALAFKKSFVLGFGTLDMFATIFLGSLVLSVLTRVIRYEISLNLRQHAWTGFKAGLISLLLLSLVYIGMGYVGAYYAQGLHLDVYTLFAFISYKLFGVYGTTIMGAIVLLACFSPAVAISAMVAEYVQNTVFKNSISYIASLVLVLIACIPASTIGFATVIHLTRSPVTAIGYPVLIVITLCNIAYKLTGFKPIKLPVALTFFIATASYYFL